MSISSGEISSSSFQSKQFIRDLVIKCNIRFPKSNPGHIRRPPPNEMSLKSVPLTSILDPKNLSGMKLSGFSHMLGSLPMAHALTNTCEPSETLKPQRSASVPALQGLKMGQQGASEGFI
ncbi:hypothetical protein V6N11_066348 [Hibiscus sabdariffa]|uniref:Uncharacterized protein n=2 Tax=Hibiscus sabdariffa TaxID=183260 RepID=A0ABR2B7Z0_9ROSI